MFAGVCDAMAAQRRLPALRSVHYDGVFDACSASSRDTCCSVAAPSAVIILVNAHWAGVASERRKQRLRHILGVRLRLQHRVGVPHADAAVRQSAGHQAQLQGLGYCGLHVTKQEMPNCDARGCPQRPQEAWLLDGGRSALGKR